MNRPSASKIDATDYARDTIGLATEFREPGRFLQFSRPKKRAPKAFTFGVWGGFGREASVATPFMGWA